MKKSIRSKESKQLNEWKRLSGIKDKQKKEKQSLQEQVEIEKSNTILNEDWLVLAGLLERKEAIQGRSAPDLGNTSLGGSNYVSNDVFEREAEDPNTFVIDPEKDTPHHDDLLTKVGYLESPEDENNEDVEDEDDDDIEDEHYIEMDDDHNDEDDEDVLDQHEGLLTSDNDEDDEEDFLGEEPFIARDLYSVPEEDDNDETYWAELENEDDMFKDEEKSELEEEMEDEELLQGSEDISGHNYPMGEDSGFSGTYGMYESKRNLKESHNSRVCNNCDNELYHKYIFCHNCKLDFCNDCVKENRGYCPYCGSIDSEGNRHGCLERRLMPTPKKSRRLHEAKKNEYIKHIINSELDKLLKEGAYIDPEGHVTYDDKESSREEGHVDVNVPPIEQCAICDTTIHDDPIKCIKCKKGPFCLNCFDGHMQLHDKPFGIEDIDETRPMA